MKSFTSVLVLLGDRYLVVDCGGGTVDLTVHEVKLPEGHLKELYKASGKAVLLYLLTLHNILITTKKQYNCSDNV